MFFIRRQVSQHKAICAADGCKTDTARTAKLKGQNRQPIIFYDCGDNADWQELNYVLSTPCFSKNLTPASGQKKDTGIINYHILNKDNLCVKCRIS